MFDFIRKKLKAKDTAKAHRHLMRNGEWHLQDRQFVLMGDGPTHFKSAADTYISNVTAGRASLKAAFKDIIINALKLNKVKIDGQDKTFNASYFYFSRAGDFKLFDSVENAVLTTTDQERWSKYQQIEQLDIFKYFRKPDTSLVKDHTGLMRHETLLSAPAIGSMPKQDQISAFTKVCTTYSEYVVDHRSPPRPDVIMSSYREVLDLLPDEQKEALANHHDRISELAQRYYFVQAHLDFNLVNILVDEYVWLIDLEDAGLRLPAMYDVLNFVLNEVYERRSLWMLEFMRAPDFRECLENTLSASVIDGRPEDFETAILINFVLRESSTVSPVLLKDDFNDETNRARVLRNWKLFKEILPN